MSPFVKTPRRQKWVLLNPGPVNVTKRVRESLLGPDLCHREAEFGRLLQRIRSKLLDIFGVQGSHEAAFLTGSGTLAVETMLTSYAADGRKILVLSNGVYGERMAEILSVHRLPHAVLKSGPGCFPSIKDMETAFKKDPRIRAVAMVHHETSSGMLNPLESVGRLAKKHGKTFLVDAVSSLGAENIVLKRYGIDFLAGSSGKCLHAYPGVAFVLISKRQARRLPQKTHGVYADLTRYLGNDPPFTPAVQLFYALNAALDELRREGLAGRIRSYEQKNFLLQEGLTKLGIRFLVPKEHRSHVLTAAWLPSGMSYGLLHSRLKQRGFVIYAGQSSLKDRIFRISNMGDVSQANLRRFLGCFKNITGKLTVVPKPTAIVLAAGVGKRLGAMTRTVPKCLIPLSKDARLPPACRPPAARLPNGQGSCLLRRYFETFRAVGVTDVVIVVGHQKEKIIRAAAKWGGDLKVRFIKNPGYRCGSILSLYRASSELKKPVLIMDADVFFPDEALIRLIDADKTNVFLIDPRSKSSGEEMMLMAKNNRPWSIAKKIDPSLKVLGEATGIVRLDERSARTLRGILKKFYLADDLDREYEDAYCELLKRKKVGTVSMDGLFWSEIDFQEDLDTVSQALR